MENIESKGVAMEYIPAKTILSPYGKNENWFGSNYNMNLYKGCSHGCIYCDSRSECYRIEEFDRVRAKKDALIILEKELISKRKAGVIGMGAMSDPYNSFEKELHQTERALALIDRYRFGVALATKSNLIERDRDILRDIQKHSPVIVKITITSADDKLARIIEPRVSPTSERFAAMENLSSAGIFTGLLLMPVLPFIEDNWDNVGQIIRYAHDAGARFIFPGFGVTLRDNQRDWFYKELDKSFPGLRPKYEKSFKEQYGCGLPHVQGLKKQFERECSRMGILYRMGDIVKASREAHGRRQLSLF